MPNFSIILNFCEKLSMEYLYENAQLEITNIDTRWGQNKGNEQIVDHQLDWRTESLNSLAVAQQISSLI